MKTKKSALHGKDKSIVKTGVTCPREGALIIILLTSKVFTSGPAA